MRNPVSDKKVLKRRGPKKKAVTASVTLRFRVFPEQEEKFKLAAKLKGASFSKWAVDALSKEAGAVIKAAPSGIAEETDK